MTFFNINQSRPRPSYRASSCEPTVLSSAALELRSALLIEMSVKRYLEPLLRYFCVLTSTIARLSIDTTRFGKLFALQSGQKAMPKFLDEPELCTKPCQIFGFSYSLLLKSNLLDVNFINCSAQEIQERTINLIFITLVFITT